MKSQLPTLKEYIDSVGWIKACLTLDKVEPTLRSRLRSGKDWRVVTIGKRKRCAMVDDI